MKPALSIHHIKKDDQSFPLSKLISRQLHWSQPLAVKKNSLFINDIAPDFCVAADKELVAVVIYYLFDSIVDRLANSCVRITAKRYGNIVLLRLVDSTITFQRLQINWDKVKPIAEKLGGCVTLNDITPYKLHVTFSFRSL